MSSRISYQLLQPHKSLKPFISYYWYMQTSADYLPAEEVIIPDGFAEIIFNMGTAYSWRQPSKSPAATLNRVHIIGQKSTSAVVELPAALYQLGVKLKPAGVTCLLQWPAIELTDHLLCAEDLKEDRYDFLAEQLWHAPSLSVQHRELDNFFLQKLPQATHTEGIADEAIRYMLHNKGNIRIETLKNHLQVSYKVIEKRLRQQTGLSPKEFARVIRFKHLYKAFRRANHQDRFSFLDYGIYDQSHFIKEFRYFLHDAPSSYQYEQSRYTDAILKMGINRNSLLYRSEEQVAGR